MLISWNTTLIFFILCDLLQLELFLDFYIGYMSIKCRLLNLTLEADEVHQLSKSQINEGSGSGVDTIRYCFTQSEPRYNHIKSLHVII